MRNDKPQPNSACDLIAELKGLDASLEEKQSEIGAIDGYNYDSGYEYGLRVARLAIEKRLKAQPDDGLYKKLVEALKPFARIGQAFSFSVGPDGIDDDLTVVVYPHVRRELEQTIGTAAFTAALEAIKGDAGK